MAYYTQINARSNSLIERGLVSCANALQELSARYVRYSVYRESYAELSRLGDRELADLGMSRSMIRGLAWETAENYAGLKT